MGKEKRGRENAEAKREQDLEGGADCAPSPATGPLHIQHVAKYDPCWPCFLKPQLWELPGSPVVRTQCSHRQGAWVQPLVGELRSRKPRGTAKKNQKHQKNIRTSASMPSLTPTSLGHVGAKAGPSLVSLCLPTPLPCPPPCPSDPRP